MATNALLIEFGIERPLGEDAPQEFKRTLETLGAWKSKGLIEEFRVYPVVTGNRAKRIGMVLLEMSHEQLEKIVVDREYIEFIDGLMGKYSNVTTNRAITHHRMLEIAAR